MLVTGAEEVSSEDLDGDIRAPSVQGDAFWVAGCPCNISTYDGQTGQWMLCIHSSLLR